jgi:hypothetical protein
MEKIYENIQTFLEWPGAATLFNFLSLLFLAITVFLAWKAYKATAAQARTADHGLKLANPPRFKITRPIVYKQGMEPSDKESQPAFTAGEVIRGQAYAVNYGRYTAAVSASSGRFYWALNDIVPMNEAYMAERERQSGVADGVPLAYRNGAEETGPVVLLDAGGFGVFRGIETQVPEDFHITDGKWSHSLYLLGYVKYLGAADDQRGYHFGMRYCPESQRFHLIEHLSNED